MRYLTTASTEAEAEIICSRLRSAGIVAVIQGGTIALRARALRARDIYVDDHDLDAARELCNGSEGISEADLIEAEEADAAARAAQRRTCPPENGSAPAPARKRGRLWARLRGRRR